MPYGGFFGVDAAHRLSHLLSHLPCRGSTQPHTCHWMALDVISLRRLTLFILFLQHLYACGSTCRGFKRVDFFGTDASINGTPAFHALFYRSTFFTPATDGAQVPRSLRG
jgi:hypothetical protein